MKPSQNVFILLLLTISVLCLLIGTVWYVVFSGELPAAQLTAAGWLLLHSIRTYCAYRTKNKLDIIVNSSFLCLFLGMMIFALFFLK